MKISVPFCCFRNPIHSGIRYFLAGCLLLSISCTKNENFKTSGEDKLVLLAEVTAGESAHVTLTKSLSAGKAGNPDFEKIIDASVTITSSDGDEWQLTPDIAHAPASQSGALYTYPVKFKPNTSYSIQAVHPPQGAIRASTTIPGPFTVKEAEADETSFANQKVYEIKLEIEDRKDEANYYILEALKQSVKIERYFFWNGVKYDYNTQQGKDMHEYIEDEEDIKLPVTTDTVVADQSVRLRLFTKDNQTDNSNVGNTDSSFNRIFFRDENFNGKSYSTSVFIPQNQVLSNDRKEIGKLIIQVKSVDQTFYNYLLQYERYKSDFGSLPLSALTAPAGNIQNGLGIFGGVYKVEKVFYNEDLD